MSAWMEAAKEHAEEAERLMSGQKLKDGGTWYSGDDERRAGRLALLAVACALIAQSEQAS